MKIDKQLQTFIRSLKRPPLIFAIVAVFGFIPLAASFTTSLVPALQAKGALDRELAALEARRAELEASPVPEPFDPESAAEWLKKVPLHEDHAEFLSSLLVLESDSGAKIQSFRLGQEEESIDQMILELEKAQASNAATIGSLADARPSGSVDDSAAEETKPAAPGGIAAESVSLEAVGGYEETVAFWRGLAAMQRLAAVTSWTLSAEAIASDAASATESLLGKETTTQQPKMRVRLRLELNIFTATAFPELSAVEKERTGQGVERKREDPTLTDDAFFERLDVITEEKG